MKEDFERDYLKEKSFIEEMKYEEELELIEHIRITSKLPAEINIEIPKRKHEHIDKADSLPF